MMLIAYHYFEIMVGSMKITKTFSQQSLLQETKQKKNLENKNLLFLIEIFINDKIEKVIE